VIAFRQALYFRLLIPLLHMGAKIAATTNPKVGAALGGKRVPTCSHRNRCPRFWFHVSSLGEFEQAKPVIEALKGRYPGQAVWVSFFSPSGHDYGMEYEHAEEVFYLPMHRSELRQAFEIIDPHMVIVVKVDLWPGLAWEASHRSVPIVLVDGTLTASSSRNSKLFRPLQRSFYSHLSGVAAVSNPDAERIRKLCGDDPAVSVTGDSKYDRVWNRAMNSRSLGLLDTILDRTAVPILVAGSTYEQEELVLLHALARIRDVSKRLAIVLVPHEPTESRLTYIEQLFGSRQWLVRRLGRLSPGEQWQILLIDKVGILAETYRHADIVFVGGSFKAKVHNVLEPAVFGKPIVVGPYYRNSPEAVSMIEQCALLSVDNAEQLAALLEQWLESPDKARRLGTVAHTFVESRLRASDRIARFIEQWLPRIDGAPREVQPFRPEEKS
jgi:3-deoxy-D-manno-octulosonic-acid transferase